MTAAWRPPHEPAALGNPDDVVMLIVGPSFCLADVVGDVSEGAPLGWFVADRRVLSRVELFVDGARCESLGVHREEAFESLHVLRTAPGALPGLLLVRRRALDGGLVEEIQVFNHGPAPRTCRVVLKVDVDFADLFAVKDRRPIDRTQPGTTTGLACVDDALHYTWTGGGATRRTSIVATPSSAAVLPGRIVWTLQLEPQAHAEIGVHISHELVDTGREPQRRGTRALVMSSRDQARQWERGLPVVETGNPVVDEAIRRSGADLGSLRLFDPEDPSDPVVAAGAPWFMTLFGRDSIITSLFSLHADRGLARGVVHALAKLQGNDTDDDTDEQPGKILHELRFSQATSFSLRAGAPYFGSVDATPLFVHLVGELARWSSWGADEIGPLMPAVDLALDWMLGDGDTDQDGFVEYDCRSSTGLVNQGWKDSWDGIRHGDGRVAETPIALAEVQAYVFAAFHARSGLATALGDSAGAAAWAARAATLADQFNDRFWLGPDKGFAIGLDRENQPIDSVTSNMGHCLWTGIAAPRARVRCRQAPDVARDVDGMGYPDAVERQPGLRPAQLPLRVGVATRLDDLRRRADALRLRGRGAPHRERVVRRLRAVRRALAGADDGHRPRLGRRTRSLPHILHTPGMVGREPALSPAHPARSRAERPRVDRDRAAHAGVAPRRQGRRGPRRFEAVQHRRLRSSSSRPGDG